MNYELWIMDCGLILNFELEVSGKISYKSL
jgi:hypothetical protein